MRVEPRPRAAEFFAGIGLVRMGLERAGFQVVFANDIDPVKQRIYSLNFPSSMYALSDIREISGRDLPDVEIATASFPCTDLSVAGNRAGLAGSESSLLFEFLRVLREMGSRRPQAVLLENVLGFASSRRGADLRETVAVLNRLGYTCDVVVVDARWFVPQSRPRLFLLAFESRFSCPPELWRSPLRPAWLSRFTASAPGLHLTTLPIPRPPVDSGKTLDEFVEDVPANDPRWWVGNRLTGFLSSLSAINRRKLAALMARATLGHATAYRRTRRGAAVWEIRGDHISGCLRTSRGGSSRQALLQAGLGQVRVRWMTAREYARLQGAPDLFWDDEISENQVKFALGDAVCVPAVAWLLEHGLKPLLLRSERPRPATTLPEAALACAAGSQAPKKGGHA